MATAPMPPEPLPRLPLVLAWGEPDNPLPVRALRTPAGPVGPPVTHPLLLPPPPWLASGPAGASFDFCGRMRDVCADVAARCPELAHIDTSRLLFAVTQARNGLTHGLQARVTPLRFPGGRLTRQRHGVVYQVQRYLHREVEFLYLVTFCLPRFLNQDFDDKLITLFHELYHISPAFDGDLRRHEGRYSLHTHSQRSFDERMAHLARAYLAGHPDPGVLDFLRLNFAQLERRHGNVIGVVVPRPKIVPVARQTRPPRSPD